MIRRPIRLLSAAEAEKLLGIPAARVRKWHQLHKVTGLYAYGLDRSRRPLYLESDLRRLNAGKRIRDDDGERLDDSK